MSKREPTSAKADNEPSLTDEVLGSQIAYYRAHAPSYDDWWFRGGRHDLGEEFRAKWEAEISAVRSALYDFAPRGDVLEIAGGTGNWTVELARLANSVTVIDTSPEAVAIARGKVTGNVTWVIADIFNYRPDRRYDAVFFAFWLSHVPRHRFADFWRLVDDCLAPGGRIFFVDNAHPSRARDVMPEPFRWREGAASTSVKGIDSVTDPTTGISTRRAADGESYDVVKIWWEPEELESRVATLGWNLHVTTTQWAFLYGHGSRGEPS
jgi:demethylmenaquinone methyltransferase/2-methoxy-6-polyprenyl-1,4-benzoquinol methylase